MKSRECFSYKKRSLAESVSTNAKLCVPMNMIGGNQTHPKQRSIAHLWWKSTLNLAFPKHKRKLTIDR
uniref:SFRICE_022928 n=1 Tax=Spodoptera frugiperda TaxID=7108 RepID=A0A2H1WF07_SPOFR